MISKLKWRNARTGSSSYRQLMYTHAQANCAEQRLCKKTARLSTKHARGAPTRAALHSAASRGRPNTICMHHQAPAGTQQHVPPHHHHQLLLGAALMPSGGWRRQSGHWAAPPPAWEGRGEGRVGARAICTATTTTTSATNAACLLRGAHAAGHSGWPLLPVCTRTLQQQHVPAAHRRHSPAPRSAACPPPRAPRSWSRRACHGPPQSTQTRRQPPARHAASARAWARAQRADGHEMGGVGCAARTGAGCTQRAPTCTGPSTAAPAPAHAAAAPQHTLTLSSSAQQNASTAQPHRKASTPSAVALAGPVSCGPNCQPPTPHMQKPHAAAATTAQFCGAGCAGGGACVGAWVNGCVGELRVGMSAMRGCTALYTLEER